MINYCRRGGVHSNITVKHLLNIYKKNNYNYVFVFSSITRINIASIDYNVYL